MGHMNSARRTNDEELDGALAKAIRQLITVALGIGAALLLGCALGASELAAAAGQGAGAQQSATPAAPQSTPADSSQVKALQKQLKEVQAQLRELAEQNKALLEHQKAIDRQLLAADMPAAAQATRVYDDYLRELAKTHPDDLAVLAVSLIGPRNQVAKLVRHLELLP